MTDERKRSYTFFFKIMLKIALKAKYLIADSDSTKRDFINYSKIPKQRVTTVYGGY